MYGILECLDGTESESVEALVDHCVCLASNLWSPIIEQLFAHSIPKTRSSASNYISSLLADVPQLLSSYSYPFPSCQIMLLQIYFLPYVVFLNFNLCVLSINFR